MISIMISSHIFLFSPLFSQTFGNNLVLACNHKGYRKLELSEFAGEEVSSWKIAKALEC